MEKIIVIVGPTCSGKTKLSLKIAEKLNAEIISADSRQVYKKLDIGTAKPDKLELNKVKHYFIDELDPDEDFNVSMFEKKANYIIKNILNKKGIPIVVGGSGLYIKSLIDGITESTETSKEIRDQLMELRAKFGNEYLYKELMKVDPESAGKMLPQNWKRVIRALEVFTITGRTIWEHHQSTVNEKEFSFMQFGLLWERQTLYRNIEDRVNEMFDKGLVDEVQSLLKMGFQKTLNSLNTVGYKEVIEYLEGNINLEKTVELVKRNTRRYAKRQMTWFNRDNRIDWKKVTSIDDIDLISDGICKMYN